MANIPVFSGARPKQTSMQRFAAEKYNFEHADHNFALDPTSAANRRKKKRPTAGVKTIEVNRGRFGFGFTLSGQSPCILSSVIAGSPAERVGLHSGDCLIAVNGRNVSKLPHNEVVKLISLCPGSLKVQIAENYCTDSSSEDEGGRTRPKYPHRRFPNRKDRPLAEINSNQARFENGRDLWLLNNQIKPRELEYYQSDSESCREKLPSPRKHVRSNSADSSFVDLNTSAPLMSTPKKKSEPAQTAHKKVDLNAMDELNIGGELNSFFNQNLSELRKSIKLHNQRKHNIDISTAESKCVVGYLGTIEMPKGVNQGASSGLQEIRNCIRRLRVEKKVHTLVLFCIFPSQVVLINHHGLKLAEFAAENIKFCGVYADDRRFFGLVTSQMRGGEESDSSSCHVFMVEPINSQNERQQRANTFQFDLTFNNNGDCVEFPVNADPILAVIYQLRGLSPAQENQEPHQLQDIASTSSSSGSSNSDSGIGFRDEALQPQGAERALVVDVQNERIRLQNLTRIQEQQQLQQQENIRGLPPRHPHNASISSSDSSLPSEREKSAARTSNMSPPPVNGSTSKLTVRAMPDPALGLSNPASADSSFNTDRLESLQSAEHIRLSMQKYLQDKHEHLKKTSQLLVDKNTATGSNPNTVPNTAQNINKKVFDKLTSSWEARGRPVPQSSVSDRSFVRSLEDLRSVDNGSVYSHTDLDLGPPSLPVNPHLPLARFLYSSDSNLSQLEVPPLAPLDLANHPLNKWQEAQGSYSSTVLRPCDQYPEQGLVKRRDRSAHSTSSNRSYRASVHVESSDYDNISWRDMGRVSQRSTMSKSQSLKRREKNTGDEFERMSFNGDVESISSRRESTLGRVRERRKSDSASIINDQNDIVSITGSQGNGSPKKDIGRVGGWAADFEKLLNDAAGLQTFSEFLKKEFSHENIYFWCACEKYKSIESGIDKLRFARDVMERHLAQGASDPVNVDSMARSSTQERLSLATPENPPDTDLFLTAQTQIYNLMKFDSFSRFLKSDLYKDSLLADMAGNPLPFDGQDLDFDLMTTAVLDLDKSDSSIKKSGETRRKSILPWNNIRNRSKSKDRGDQNTSDSKPAMFIKKLTGQNSSDKSRQSLSNSELKVDVKDLSDPLNHSSESCERESCTLTRFILPDRATTVVSTPQGETIRSLVSRLLDKRGLKFTSFDAFVTGNEKPLDLSEDCSTLGCSEVRVEPRVLFRLELPSKKSIGVKAKQTKLVEEVLGPILSQYGWSLQDMTVRLDQGPRRQESVDMKASVTSIDNSRLVVQHQSEDPSLRTNESENDSNRSDSRPNSRSSLSLGPRRQSNSSIESRKPDDLMPPPKIIPINKRRPLITATSSTSKDQEASLYEGLKRMTKGRLDDQRGLEINGELPDFLKKGSRASEPIKSEASRVDLTTRLSGPAELGNLTGWDRDHARHYIDYIDSTFTSEGLIPSMAEADELFNQVNPDESLNFNESRLSLGMGRLSMGSAGYPGIEGMRVVSRPSIGTVRDYEGIVMGPPRDYDMLHKAVVGSKPGLRDHIGVPGVRDHPGVLGGRVPPARDYEAVIRPNTDYEGVNFNTRKDYEHLSFRPNLPPQVAPKPRLTSVDEDAVPTFVEAMPKRPPPPLPPKPVRGPPPLPPHAQHLHNNFGKPHPLHSHELHELPVGVTRTKNGVHLGMPGEKGYNVSFV